MKKCLAALTALSLVAGLELARAGSATADGGLPDTGTTVNTTDTNVQVDRIEVMPLQGVEVVEDYNSAGQPESVTALYNGNVINLATGWAGASTCAVYSATDVRCYDSHTEFVQDGNGDAAGTSSSTDGNCTYGWSCIWEHINYTGRRLQFRDAGSTQKLSAYGFQNQASSVWNRMTPGKRLDVIDFRSYQWDPYLVWDWGTAHPNFTKIPYSGGGTWNDKADAIRIRQQ